MSSYNYLDKMSLWRSKGSCRKFSLSKRKKTYRPPDSHYYKYRHTLVKMVAFEDGDTDNLKMLEEIFLTKYAW